MKSDEEKTPGLRAAILAGCMVAFLGFGFAATFGVFLTPMSQDLGWGREVFSLSVAVQLLTWGFAQPIAGAVADRFGTARVLAFGAICAGIGFALRGMTTDPTAFVLTGIFVGAGTGAASFPIVIGALGKIVSAERRSFILGLGTAAASLGMFVAAPTATTMIGTIGWQTALIDRMQFCTHPAFPDLHRARGKANRIWVKRERFRPRLVGCLHRPELSLPVLRLFRLRVSRGVHPNPFARLCHGSWPCRIYWGLVAGIDRPV